MVERLGRNSRYPLLEEVQYCHAATANEAGGGIRKHSKKPFRSRLITGSQYWEDFDSLRTLSGSDSYSTSEFRKYTPQILAAHANVIDNVSLNITPRNVGFKGAAGSIFRK